MFVCYRRYAKSQSKAKMEARLRGYRDVETGLQTEIDGLNKTRQLEVGVNTALVDFLTSKSRDLENLTQEWSDKCVVIVVGVLLGGWV